MENSDPEITLKSAFTCSWDDATDTLICSALQPMRADGVDYTRLDIPADQAWDVVSVLLRCLRCREEMNREKLTEGLEK
jgi:hypothetical protein